MPFPCLADPSGAAYRAYDLPRGGIRQILGPAVLARGIKAFLKGARGGRPVGPVKQLSGEFFIFSDGVIRAAHRARHAGDNRSASSWLREVRELGG